jgi:hypothetical protein
MKSFFLGFEKRAVSAKWIIAKLKSGIKSRAKKDPHTTIDHELKAFESLRGKLSHRKPSIRGFIGVQGGKKVDPIDPRLSLPVSFTGRRSTQGGKKPSIFHWRSGSPEQQESVKSLVAETKNRVPKK